MHQYPPPQSRRPAHLPVSARQWNAQSLSDQCKTCCGFFRMLPGILDREIRDGGLGVTYKKEI
jgi:hypothetical protein